MAEFSVSGSTVTHLRSNLWGLDLSGSMTGAGGVGGLLAIYQAPMSAPAVHFTAYDGNGNIVGLVKAGDGTASARYEYGPFGEPLRATGDAIAAANPWRFSTKRADPVTSLVHYEYRVYNPVTGRWPNRDPLMEEGGRNLYGFVRNDPLDYWDILGQKCCLRTYHPGNGSTFGHSVLTCGANNEVYISLFPRKGSGHGIFPMEGQWHAPINDAAEYQNITPTEVCTDCLDEGKVKDWVKQAKEDKTKWAITYNCSNATADAIAAGLPSDKQKKPGCGKCSLLERLVGAVNKYPRDLLTQDTGFAGSASTGQYLITLPEDVERRFKDVVGNGCNRWKCDIQWNSRQGIIGP